MDQENIILQSEADAWYQRNTDCLNQTKAEQDAVVRIIKERELIQKENRVLEIGCANAYKLEYLRQNYQGEYFGIDPSALAVADAKNQYPYIDVKQKLIEDTGFASDFFDVVIIGFCLYLCSREKLSQIVAEVDRILKRPGYLIIHDFFSPEASVNNYQHDARLQCYKMDNSELFTKDGQYREIYRHLERDDGAEFDGDYSRAVAVHILQGANAV